MDEENSELTREEEGKAEEHRWEEPETSGIA
jgi:hypothetical protein